MFKPQICDQLVSKRQLLCKTFLKYSSDAQVRLRFAPSPTGSIHLGGLRSALYNYIYARKFNGKFILRIEDTDQSRIVPGSSEEIEDVLTWAGLLPDESPRQGGDYGPYIQSHRLRLYQDHADELLESGKAYRCFCSSTRLELLRKLQSRNREAIRYDGNCRSLKADEIKRKIEENEGRFAVRYKLRPQKVIFNDLVFGELSTDMSQSTESDPIIMKTDRYPTYHMANVVDDHLMEISHVLRGSEWIASTSKHIQLYQAFGWSQPQFAHFPLITMKDGSKMSKRNQDSTVNYWIREGYLPDTLLNFLTNMGGGLPKAKQDNMDLWKLSRIIDEFKFEQVASHPASIDLDRLRKYNAKALKAKWDKDPKIIVNDLRELLVRNGIQTDLTDIELKQIIGSFIGARLQTLNDFVNPQNLFLWKTPEQSDIDMTPDEINVIDEVVKMVQECGDQYNDREFISMKLVDIAKRNNMSQRKLFMFLRKLLVGSDRGLPIFDIFACLGKTRLLLYLNKHKKCQC